MARSAGPQLGRARGERKARAMGRVSLCERERGQDGPPGAEVVERAKYREGKNKTLFYFLNEFPNKF